MPFANISVLVLLTRVCVLLDVNAKPSSAVLKSECTSTCTAYAQYKPKGDLALHPRPPPGDAFVGHVIGIHSNIQVITSYHVKV